MPLINTETADTNLTVTVEGLDGSSVLTYNGETEQSLTVPTMQRFEALETSLNNYLASMA